MYVAAIRSLGCVVENLIAIEDSANGVAAAKSAQLFCLGFLSDKTQDLGMADATIQTFKELRLCLQQ